MTSEPLALFYTFPRLPARLAPRVVSSVEEGRLYFDLWIGRCMVGSYDPKQQQWEIRRPFHLLIDERALPSWAAEG